MSPLKYAPAVEVPLAEDPGRARDWLGLVLVQATGDDQNGATEYQKRVDH